MTPTTLAAETSKDPTFPKATRSPAPTLKRAVVGSGAKWRARQASIDEAALASRDMSQSEIQHRNTLADGEATSTPNLHLLANALRFVRQGRATFTGFLQRAMRNGDADARAWWGVYSDLLPAQQARVDFDDVCEAAGVAPDRIMAVVVSAAMRLGTDVGDLVAATMHPALVERTTKSAMRIGGTYASIAQKDREMLFQHQRFIPVPKGTSVHVHASAQAAAAAANQPSVPTFMESLDGASSAHADVQRQLANKPILDAEVE